MASITELTDIPPEASTIELGIGSFEVPTDGNKTHTYNLEIHFPNQDYDQNENQGKQIKAYVLTENYIPPTLSEYVISLSSDSEITGVYEENGYRYQGLNPNNYISFNNELWRIIGVFDDYTHEITGQNLVKIIKLDSIGSFAWNSKGSNNWNTSSLKEYLNDEYYNNLNGYAQNMIENVTWKLAGPTNNDLTAAGFYAAERGTSVFSGNPVA